MNQFKHIIALLLGIVLLLACKEEFEIELYNVSIQLNYPEGYIAQDSVKVYVGYYSAHTDSTGTAKLEIPAGSYAVTASESRAINGSYLNFNGSSSITAASDITNSLNLTVSKSSQLIIKELYIGGCPTDDGSDVFTKDAFITLYNNSDIEAVIDSNFCIAFSFTYNSNQSNSYLDGNGNLRYDEEGWIPASTSLWHFQSATTLAPGEQLVLVVFQAIDQTATYSNSLDLSHSEYYPMYDLDAFNHTKYYVAPSEKIPSTHYLDAIKYGLGSAWALSQSSPALFIFRTEGMGPAEFASDASLTDYYGGLSNQVSQKVPREWVIDAVDIFRQGYNESNNKRFTDDIDAGYITFSNNKGYTVYRNVDKELTEAIEENKGLIIYDYSAGTEGIVDGSTDPSGIDAEASIASGARIVYKDSNNSSNDFHQRSSASIK